MRLAFWTRDRAIVCRQAVDLMTGYLEGSLPARDRRRIEGHLAACPHCSEHLAQLRVTIDALGHVEPEHLSDDALDDLLEVFRRFRAGEGDPPL